jgi:hypothetical protein
MRKFALAAISVAALAGAGLFATNAANAMTVAPGLGLAADAVSPVEDVHWRRYHRHRHHVFFHRHRHHVFVVRHHRPYYHHRAHVIRY